MNRNHLVAAILLLIAILSAAGCKRTPAYVGDYGIVLTDDFKKKASDTAMAFAKANPGMKGQIEKGLKEMESNAAKVTLSIKEDGKCTIGEEGKNVQSAEYTFADNKLTIKAAPTSLGVPGNDLVLTWDEAKGTLTAGQDTLGLMFKKK